MTSLRWIALDWVIKVRPGVNTNAFDDLTAMWLKKHGLINLDDGVFEVYKGFNKDPMAPGRYARSLSGSGGYAGVRLIDSIPLEQLQGLTDGDCQALLSKWEPRDADE
jgi:hypothetical protein